MRVCMPTLDERGLEGRLSPHFGRAPFFTMVDDETGEVAVLANVAAQHEHGSGQHGHGGCAPVGLFGGQGLDAVICRGLGRGAHLRLRETGLRVYLTDSWEVAGALAAWRAGQLAEAEAGQLCAGHGHGHGH